MKEDKNSMIAELEVGADFTSLMSVTSLFFTGILISQYKSFNSTIKVPLIYLLISTFSFIFAATIYNNAGNELTLNKVKSVQKHMVYAKNIGELLGLYLLVLAVPMVIGAVTQDSFLRVTTTLVAIAGFVLYSQSKFSVLEKELSRHKKRYLSWTITILALLLYLTQQHAVHHSLYLYSFISIVLLLIIVATATSFSVRSKQYKPVIVRNYRANDADKLSRLLTQYVNGLPEGTDQQTTLNRYGFEGSIPEALKKLAEEKQIFIAEFDHKVVGMACLKSQSISDVFTDPGMRNKGVGRALIEGVEDEAVSKNIPSLHVYASSLEQKFYIKLGYEKVKEVKQDHDVKDWLMEKAIYSSLT